MVTETTVAFEGNVDSSALTRYRRLCPADIHPYPTDNISGKATLNNNNNKKTTCNFASSSSCGAFALTELFRTEGMKAPKVV